MHVEMSILIPGHYHRLSNVLETDGRRTNIHFLQPERDSSNSNRLVGSALTLLPSPACSVSHSTAAFSFSCLVDKNVFQECFLVLNFSKCVWAFKLVWWHASPQPLLSFSGRCLQLLLCLPITASLCHQLSAGLKQIRINNLWMDLSWLRKLTLTGIISDLDFNKMIEPFPWFRVDITDESHYPGPTVNSPSSEEGFWALW